MPHSDSPNPDFKKGNRDSIEDPASAAPSEAKPGWWATLLQIGPAVIVAAVVLGPGSIVNASRVGCRYGYDRLWVVVLAGMLMMAMTTASMQIGVFSRRTPSGELRHHFGGWAAWLVGGSLWIAIALFQASNNHAIAMALEGFGYSGDATVWVLGLNAIVIGLIWAGRRNLYRIIERSMMGLVGLMVLAFFATLLATRPDVSDIVSGLIPGFASTSEAAVGIESEASEIASDRIGPAESVASDAALDWMSVVALMATTFSVAAGFFQSYQVRQRGWRSTELSLGRRDAMIGIATLALTTAAIVVTAAGALHGRVDASELKSAAVVASQLKPLFGESAALLFSIGILAGALSSFVVNALIGGVVASDALDRGVDFSSPSVRGLTVVALLAGMVISLSVQMTGYPLVNFIVVAQSLTVFSFPLLAVTLIWQWSGIRGRLHAVERVLVGSGLVAGLFVVLALATRTVITLAEKWG